MIDVLGRSEVTCTDGARVPLARFWAERDCLFVFLRHFACPSCCEMVALTLPRVHEIAALGAYVVMVGSGSLAALHEFASVMHLDDTRLALVTSPDLAAYRAAGMVRSRYAAYKPLSLWTSLKLYALGHRKARRSDDGDVQQQGGMLLVRRGGTPWFHHADRDLADHASLDEVMALLLAAAAVRAGALA